MEHVNEQRRLGVGPGAQGRAIGLEGRAGCGLAGGELGPHLTLSSPSLCAPTVCQP